MVLGFSWCFVVFSVWFCFFIYWFFMASVLYISHNGLSEPLGRSQILPYLWGLYRRGHGFRVLSFEPEGSVPPEPAAVPGSHVFEIRRRGEGMLSKIRDVQRGVEAAVTSHGSETEEIDLIHCRSYLPTALGMLARVKGKLDRAKLVFDMRGFLPQEYLDNGHWKATDIRYLVSKFFEAQLLAQVDGVVVLTERAELSMREWYHAVDMQPPPIKVIPCCVDTDLFRRDEIAGSAIRAELGFGGPVMVYSGSLGSWYMAREMAAVYAKLRRATPSLCFLVLTQSNVDLMADELSVLGVLDEQVHITRCGYEEVPSYLSAADMGISFVRPAPSKAASSPTKIAEYLSCGLSVLTNSGVGDIDQIARGFPHIHVMRELSEDTMSKFAGSFSWDHVRRDAVRDGCREFARVNFDLEGVGVSRYDSFYHKIIES